MRTRPVARSPALACLLLAACSSPQPSQSDQPLSEVLYAGAASDEALQRMLALAPEAVSSQPWVIDTPTPNASLSAAEPIVFSFHRAASARRVEKRHLGRAFLTWLNPIGVAHAHGIPFNGLAYYLVVSDAALRPQLQVFTDRLSYTVDATRAARLRAVSQPLTLTLTAALFEENEVTTDGGPFAAGHVDFRLE